jgi:predicted  nucleic acid-binding Zn-ribbon protein
MMQTLKKKQRSILDEREEEISSLNENIISVNMQNERLENENKLLREDLFKFTKAFD